MKLKRVRRRWQKHILNWRRARRPRVKSRYAIQKKEAEK